MLKQMGNQNILVKIQIFARGYPKGFFEIPKECGIIRKTAGLVCLGNTFSGFQQVTSSDQSFVGDKGMDRNAGNVLEFAEKVVFAHVYQPGQILYRDGFVDVGVDIL